MKVLFVDDSDFYLHFRRGYFTRIGCQILNARGGAQALESIETQKPDLVIVSSRLPDTPGAELCRRVRALYKKHPPRIVLIAEAGERPSGAGEWEERLERPVDPEELMDRIAALLNVPKRRSPRLPVEMEVVYGNRRDRLRGAALNISREGMLIDAHEALPPGTRLELEFTLPEQEKPLHTEAEVVRSTKLAGGRRHGLGVKFLSPGPDVDEAVREFLG